jgi:hypothetical protein
VYDFVTELPYYSWAEGLVQFKIPGYMTNLTKNVKYRIMPNFAPPSTLNTFTVRKHPVIDTLTPSAGPVGADIVVDGEGFADPVMAKQVKVYNALGGYGYATYVEFEASNDKYRVSNYNNNYYQKNKTWSDVQLTAKTNKIIDLKNGHSLDETHLFMGCWSMKIVTDYFVDDGDGEYFFQKTGTDPVTGKKYFRHYLDLRDEDVPFWNYADGQVPGNNTGSSGGDELLYREISDTMCYNVVDIPYITGVSAKKVYAKDRLRVFGANFGPSKGFSEVLVGNRAFGNQAAGQSHTDTPVGNFKTARVVRLPNHWSNTRIRIKVPKFGTANYPKNKWVRVLRDDPVADVYSNSVRIRIIGLPLP